MLISLLRFEWRYHTRQASFRAAAFLFLVMGFALTASGFGSDNVRINSSWLVMESTGILSLLSLFAAAIFASNAVLRDVEHGMLEIVYTTPVGRFHYLFGRFAGAALATMTVGCLTAVGMLAATFMPWIDPQRLGPLTIAPYLWSLLTIMLPDVLFGTALLFAIAALTRSSVATYVGAVFGYFLYFTVSALTNSPIMAASKPGAGGGKLVALLDPFALSSFFEVTRYWSIAEKNDRFVALAGSLLINRILILVITVSIFALVYATFSFRVLRRSRRREARTDLSVAQEKTVSVSQLTTSVPTHIRPRWISSYVSATRIEWRALVWNLPFLLLLLLWMALACSELYSDLLNAEFRTSLYPTTALIIAALRQPLSLFGTILLVYLAAEIFWREERHRMSSILNATPLPSSVMIASKWTALAGLITTVIASGIGVGVLLQLAKGHTQFEPLIYLSLFYSTGLPLLLLAAAATLIHVFSPGKYAGMVFVLLFVVYTRMAGALGLEHPLWQFGNAPAVDYSDMDRFGANAAPSGWLMLHWSLISALFIVIASMGWRAIGGSFRQKLQLVLRRSTRRQRSLAASLLALSIVSGSWIFYNTNVLNEYTTEAESNDWRTQYEKAYRALATLPQPSMTDIDLTLDFFPGQHRYHVACNERLVNQTSAPIRTIWIAIRREEKEVKLSLAGARFVGRNRRYGMNRFDLDRPLAPGSSTEFRYEFSSAQRGFAAGEQDESVLSNGTFLIGSRIFPSFGYRSSYELTDARERAKRGLPPGGATDEESDAFKSVREPRVNLTATLSTSSDQTAISAGRLERRWQRDGRRYFRYRTTSPISSDAAFGTGHWSVAKRRAGDVDIELYFHPAHTQNVNRMLDAAVASVRTFESSFGPYRLGVLRMAEVPRQRFAGYASPGVLWFVENRTPVTDIRDPNRVDIVTRRVVHEVSHQWWGHQLVPSEGPGASFLVETFAKQSEAMIIERLRGRRQLDQFLEMELDRYLAGRSGERKLEDSLLRVGSQPYIYYAKGAVVMNAITNEIGESAMTEAMRGVLHQPFPKAIDFLEQLRRVSSPAGYALAEEWLQEIVLYDLKVESASARRRPDGKYDVRLRVSAGKMHADRRGNETSVPFHEAIDIGIYSRDDSPLHLQKHSLQKGKQEMTVTVDQLPAFISLDPHVTRIDKNRSDNVEKITVETPRS